MPGINTNITSLTTQQGLKKSQSTLTTSIERLSSGLRVNSAKDDAAGQAIGNRINAQRTGLGQASRNANDGISLSQTAQGTLDSINEKLQRIRELTVQGLNGTLDTRDSDSIQAEINYNLMEIDRLAETTRYNDLPLMNGQAGNVDLQIGANDGETLGVDLSPPGFSVDALGLTDFNVAGEPGSVTPRDMLDGPADDIVLEDALTEVDWPPGIDKETLYALGDVSVAGEYANKDKLEGTYYVGMGNGNFSLVDVSATHETATDESQVKIEDPRAIYEQDWKLDSTDFTELGSGQKLVKGDDTYYIETTDSDNDNVISYKEAKFDFSGSASLSAEVSSGDAMTGSYKDVASSAEFEFDSQQYKLDDYANVGYQDSKGASLQSSDTKLVKDDKTGNFYIQDSSDNEPVYYRLADIEVKNKLELTTKLESVQPENYKVVENFKVDGEEFTVEDPSSIIDRNGNSINKIVKDKKQDVYYAVDDNDKYFTMSAPKETRDITPAYSPER